MSVVSTIRDLRKMSLAADNDGGHTLFPSLAATPCPRTRADVGGCTDVAGSFARQLTQLFHNGSRLVDPLAQRDGARCHVA